MDYKNLIDKLLKQKKPFLFLDDVLSINENRIITSFYLTKTENILKGHFVDTPVLPGVIMIEMISQTSLFFMTYNLYKEEKKDIFYDAFLSKVNYFSYKSVIFPEVLIKIDVKIENTLLENFYKVKGKILVDDKIKGFGEVTLYFRWKENG